MSPQKKKGPEPVMLNLPQKVDYPEEDEFRKQKLIEETKRLENRKLISWRKSSAQNLTNTQYREQQKKEEVFERMKKEGPITYNFNG